MADYDLTTYSYRVKWTPKALKSEDIQRFAERLTPDSPALQQSNVERMKQMNALADVPQWIEGTIQVATEPGRTAMIVGSPSIVSGKAILQPKLEMVEKGGLVSYLLDTGVVLKDLDGDDAPMAKMATVVPLDAATSNQTIGLQVALLGHPRLIGGTREVSAAKWETWSQEVLAFKSTVVWANGKRVFRSSSVHGHGGSYGEFQGDPASPDFNGFVTYHDREGKETQRQEFAFVSKKTVPGSVGELIPIGTTVYDNRLDPNMPAVQYAWTGSLPDLDTLEPSWRSEPDRRPILWIGSGIGLAVISLVLFRLRK